MALHSGVAVLAKGWAIAGARRLAVKRHGNAEPDI